MLSLILVPFGVFRHTSFIGERGIGAVVAFGIKLMVLAAIMNAMQPILQTMRISSVNPTLTKRFPSSSPPGPVPCLPGMPRPWPRGSSVGPRA